MAMQTDSNFENKERKTRSSEESTINVPIGDKEIETKNGTDAEQSNEEAEMEYPHGVRLIVLVLAIVFSVFMLALDQVCRSISTPNLWEDTLLTVQDNRSNRHPQNHRPIWRPGQSLLVWLRILHDLRLFPIILGEGLQIHAAEKHLSRFHVPFRTRQLGMRCCAQPNRSHCRASARGFRRCWCSDGCLHPRSLCSGAEETSPHYWHRRCYLRNVRGHRALAWRCFHR